MKSKQFFYTRLACTNIRKNSRTYLPFTLASVCVTAMFYVICFLATDSVVAQAADSGTVMVILGLGIWVDAIFSAIFLFYTNSFLIKRRKKEFGLFNILGMEKKHIARILTLETLLVGMGSVLGGILLGMAFSKLMLILLFRLLHFSIPLGFSISPPAILYTLGLFIFVFGCILIWNLGQIRLANPIELLRGGSVGEREPKTRWFTALVGMLTVGAGYYIALTTQSPLQAIPLFFVAVILVIIGTYCLFSAGSILLLKALRKNKGYYYRPGHFYSVSGMLYRMKQNAVGLASICILSTGVMVMLSTTLSLYMGGSDVSRGRFPQDVAFCLYPDNPMDYGAVTGLIEEELAAAGIVPQDPESYAVTHLESVEREGAFFAESARGLLDSGVILYTMEQKEYTRLTGDDPGLSPGEVLFWHERDSAPRATVTVYGVNFIVKGMLEAPPTNQSRSVGIQTRAFLITDSLDTSLMLLDKARVSTGTLDSRLYFQYSFDTDAGVPPEAEIAMVRSLQGRLLHDVVEGGKKGGITVDSVELARGGFFILYGGLLFLGIFLGTLFLLATALIIYYKQVSEGYDDRERFQIMQKVGMDKWEVKNTIRSQVLTVFVLPLAAAVVHLGVAFPVLTKLLAVLYLYNIPLFAAWTGVTVLVFALFYGGVYALTAKTYYTIVE